MISRQKVPNSQAFAVMPVKMAMTKTRFTPAPNPHKIMMTRRITARGFPTMKANLPVVDKKSLVISSAKIGEINESERRTTSIRIPGADNFKKGLAIALVSSVGFATPANAAGYHMTGMMAMPADTATVVTKMMCTDPVIMENTLMSRDACRAMKKGDMKTMTAHM